MCAQENRGKLLSSWKEIADYLKCDLRTCRRWEETRHLPVHRLEGTPKSRVFAYTDELDGWVKKRNGKNGKPGQNHAENAGSRPKPIYLLLLLIPLGALALYFFAVKPYFLHPNPYDFRIERSELVILDKNANELWRYNTEREDLEDGKFYRNSFQVKSVNPESSIRMLPSLIIRDINGDNKAEVLFGTRIRGCAGRADLHCFDHRGRELWAYKMGKEIKFGSRTYTDDYMIGGFDTYDQDGDGRLEILAVGLHRPDWPTQVVILSSSGNVLAEYWHCGQINDFEFIDVDEDNRKDIILAGINNEYGKGCLVAFDPDKMGGISPQISDEFKSPGLHPGSEKFYLLFPRTDVDILSYPVESIAKIDLRNGKYLSAETTVTALYYILDNRLDIKDIIASHRFMQMHNEALQEGKISSTLDEQFIENLKKGILYYDGQGWTSSPTPVGRN